MNESIHFVILTPSKKVLDEKEVAEVYFPTTHGVVGIMPGHAPMITAVGTGVVLYSQKNVSGFVKVAGGLAEVYGDTVILLTDIGEEASNIDVERAKRSLERAEARLAAKDLGNVDVKRAQAAKARAQARIHAAELLENRMSKLRPKNTDSDETSDGV
jgi:F-type H+-transporting ATPase subunit epsilon